MLLFANLDISCCQKTQHDMGLFKVHRTRQLSSALPKSVQSSCLFLNKINATYTCLNLRNHHGKDRAFNHHGGQNALESFFV